ncbi:MAG: flagellar motor stator protein MotA [Armatimonadetes bacterium]|nr:flagellar motor stator protein MotA [Armatimonadota bacterium]
MFTFIGIGIVLVATMVGYLMHHGNIGVLIQINEFVILGGAGIGSLIAAQGMTGFQKCIKAVMGLLKPDPFTKPTFIDLLKMMYNLFNIARKEGLLGLEKHIENPEESEIIKQFPSFLNNHHATAFFCDTMKVILTGAVGPHDLNEMMELDLEVAHAEAKASAEAIQTVGDAMPGFGIVAAVLGVIITMGKIGGEAAAIGESVAAALVGTFIGILVAYGIMAPMAKAIEIRLKGEEQYMNCIRFALFSFARGESPMTCIEFSRRNIVPDLRPGFTELEAAVKEKAA